MVHATYRRMLSSIPLHPHPFPVVRRMRRHPPLTRPHPHLTQCPLAGTTLHSGLACRVADEAMPSAIDSAIFGLSSPIATSAVAMSASTWPTTDDLEAQ
eukprot:6178444-Pleurochrysis_carterae.AAC.3